jgi:membrane-bound lytic murein transglycosylase C
MKTGVGTLGRLPLVLLLLAALSSCATPPSPALVEAVLAGDEQRIARVAAEEALRTQLPRELQNLPDLVQALKTLLRALWPEAQPEVASEHRYVKYTNAYEARAIVDFDEGWLRVETVAMEAPLDKLKEAIVTTVLTPRDLRIEAIFDDTAPTLGAEPFLLGQILDGEGKALRWRWRAERFAEAVVASELKRRTITLPSGEQRTLRQVQVALVTNHLQLREKAYAKSVLATARRYDVRPSLIYAVIEVESAFNPYAVSSAKAYGLMQIVPATAGRDVYQQIKKRPGEPTKEALFDPDFNIDIGGAYLHLVDDRYLKEIKDSSSRSFATIAAYNGGVSAALRTFDRDPKRAVAQINRLASDAVYERLRRHHPFAETRRYLEKVVTCLGNKPYQPLN